MAFFIGVPLAALAAGGIYKYLSVDEKEQKLPHGLKTVSEIENLKKEIPKINLKHVDSPKEEVPTFPDVVLNGPNICPKKEDLLSYGEKIRPVMAELEQKLIMKTSTLPVSLQDEICSFNGSQLKKVVIKDKITVQDQIRSFNKSGLKSVDVPSLKIYVNPLSVELSKFVRLQSLKPTVQNPKVKDNTFVNALIEKKNMLKRI